eukprot:COSAG02_NODE_463_length_21833_cov_11.529539_15_plen_99_part_00
MHGRTSVLVVLPLPRHGESAADEVAAFRTALYAPVLSIKGAWTHASAIGTGAPAVFRAFSTPSPAPGGRRRAAGCSRYLVASRLICCSSCFTSLYELK